MIHLIDKDVLVAEIERRLQECEKWGNSCKTFAILAANQAIEENKMFLSFINSLEVKEVVLEKEIDSVEDRYQGFESLSRADIIDIAKHFFELGLRVNNEKEK